jgi:hypothetical protein
MYIHLLFSSLLENFFALCSKYIRKIRRWKTYEINERKFVNNNNCQVKIILGILKNTK